jgi:peptidoglycan hydrolase CwlO-like protein
MSHIDNFKKWGNKAAKVVTEQENTDILSVPEKFKAESDAIAQKKTSIVQMEQTLAAEKAKLNDMVKVLQTKISAENAAIANAAKAQPGTVPPPAQPATV